MYLNCHSYYSFKYGTLSVRALLRLALKHHVSSFALTDINNTSASLDFVKDAKSVGIKPVCGIDFRCGNKQQFIGIAKNNNGFQQLNRFLTRHLMEGCEIPSRAPETEDVFFVYPAGTMEVSQLRSNEFIGIHQRQIKGLIRSPLHKTPEKLVMLHPVVTARDPAHFELHKLLRCVDNNIILSKLTAEMTDYEDAYFLHDEELIDGFELMPFLVDNARTLLDQCNIDFEYGTNKNRKHYTGKNEDDRKLLEKLAWEGFLDRYEENNKPAKQRVIKELKIIHELGFSPYFLITWDILRYARSRGFHHVGRGSGANSIAAYCLGITDVCPIELDLYFERFINPHRTSPPDFDIDFSWDQRDEVIDYIFKRYGADHVALIATYSTFKGKSIVRELGKVFGLPKADMDRMIDAPEDNQNKHEAAEKIRQYGRLMEGFPSHLSIHAGGIIIAEEPLSKYTAMQMMPKGFPIVHWDMYVAEDIGFYKFDVLSQRGLGHIKEAVDIIRKNKGVDINIHRVSDFKKDPQVRRQLKIGKTIGCFYIESPAMRGLLNKLHCDNYISLVAASSIIRPGVASSGMMKEYIKRFHGEAFEYLHPIMKDQLKETYGVMIYQEDVIKVAHYFADISLADADVLRRAMSGKFRSSAEMKRVVDLFFSNCKAKGYPEELYKEVWRQIESFSGYSFSKAHSASYAVESFQSLFLKAHFPLEFMVAVINNFGGFYRTEVYVHEARISGAIIHAPCVNNSNYLTHISGIDLYLGFIHLKTLERKTAFQIIKERLGDGPYHNLDDFIKRNGLHLEQLRILIRIDALRFTGMSREELLWRAHWQYGDKKPHISKHELFESRIIHLDLPELVSQNPVVDQIDLLGFPLQSPFHMVNPEMLPSTKASLMAEMNDKEVSIAGYYVTLKKVRTIRNDIMCFGCFLDQEGYFFDTIHFPPALASHPFRGPGVYVIQGKVVLEFGFPSIEVRTLNKLEFRDNHLKEQKQKLKQLK